MPGMMETVLNIGLNDQSVRGLAAQAGNERFAFDSYRRLIQMFGKTVLGIPGEAFEEALDAAKHAKSGDDLASDLDLDAADLRRLVETFKDVVVKHAGREFPQEPREQMDLAVRAVFDSWNTSRAVLYRRQERIPGRPGHGGEHRRDGVRQSGHGLRHRGGVHPGPGVGRPGRVRGLPAERPRRGRRLRDPQHRAIDRSGADRQALLRRADAHHARPRGALPGFVRHRIHHRARQAVDAADPGRQAHGGGGVPDCDAARRPGPDRHGRGPAAGNRRPARPVDVPAIRRRRRVPRRLRTV